jgi:hypothetical protein
MKRATKKDMENPEEKCLGGQSWRNMVGDLWDLVDKNKKRTASINKLLENFSLWTETSESMFIGELQSKLIIKQD